MPTANPASRTALVAGASGLVGSHVLRLLLEDPAYTRVTILARRELPLAPKKLGWRGGVRCPPPAPAARGSGVHAGHDPRPSRAAARPKEAGAAGGGLRPSGS